MVEENTEAKDFDQIADEILDKAEQGTPADPSAEIKPEGLEGQQAEGPGAEPEKTEQVKAVESDESLSVEDKIAKVAEILGDDQGAIDAYVKEKGYHNDPAWVKQRERITQLEEAATAQTTTSEEDRVALEEFKTLRSTPEYIRMTMKSQGFTQEAIDKKLQESGHEVATTPDDDFQFVLDQTGTKREDLTQGQSDQINDMVRIANLLFEQKVGKTLGKELDPIKDQLGNSEKTSNANKITATMESTVKDEGILNYEKDIEPELNKFMDENPDAIQSEVFEHFKSINHKLTVDRLKTGNKQGERDAQKGQLRQNLPISGTPAGIPAKTGDFEKDADAYLDAAGIT